MERRVEELRDTALRGAVAGLVAGVAGSSMRLGAWFRLGLHDKWQTIEELAHARRQRRGELVEGAADVALKRRRGEALDQRPAKNRTRSARRG